MERRPASEIRYGHTRRVKEEVMVLLQRHGEMVLPLVASLHRDGGSDDACPCRVARSGAPLAAALLAAATVAWLLLDGGLGTPVSNTKAVTAEWQADRPRVPAAADAWRPWACLRGINCWPPDSGARPVSGAPDPLAFVMDLRRCQCECEKRPDCQAVVMSGTQPEGACWLRRDINISRCQRNPAWNLWIRPMAGTFKPDCPATHPPARGDAPWTRKSAPTTSRPAVTAALTPVIRFVTVTAAERTTTSAAVGGAGGASTTTGAAAPGRTSTIIFRVAAARGSGTPPEATSHTATTTSTTRSTIASGPGPAARAAMAMGCEYFAGRTGERRCSDPGTIGLSVPECRDVLGLFGKVPADPFVFWHDFDPMGCFMFGDTIYHNNHMVGRNSPGRTPICKRCQWAGDNAKLHAAYERFDRVHSPTLAQAAQAGFPERPARESWGERLRAVVEAGRQDPCNAEIVSNFGMTKVGFGSRINNVVNELMFAMYKKVSISLCRTSFESDVWEKFLTNPLNIATCNAEACTNRIQIHRDGPGLWGLYSSMPDWAAKFGQVDRPYVEELKRFLTPATFAPKPEIRHLVDRMLDNITELHVQQYIGVHIRHGDKGYEAPLLPFHRYAAEIRKHLRPGSVRVVFVASDDAAAGRQLQAELGGEAKVVMQPRLDDAAYHFTAIYDASNTRAMLVLLTDLEGLRRSSVFIGTASSNMGRLVYFLRGPHLPTISLDDDGDFLKRGG